MEQFSFQWFIALYISLGSLLVTLGFYVLIQTDTIKNYLLHAAEESNPPGILLSSLKYMLLFTIPGCILSFFPFSWIELLFSIWSLIIVFTMGQLLLQWSTVGRQIKKLENELSNKLRFIAFNMISIGLVLFMLCYILILRR